MIKKIFLAIALTAFAIALSLCMGFFPGRTVPVLMYHHVTAGKSSNALEVSKQAFEKQMAFLHAHHYRVVDAKDTVAILDGREKQGKKVMLTFDDGFADNYEIAMPVLEKFGFKGTFFVVTDWVGKPGFMTWFQIREIKKHGHTIGSHTVTHPFLTEIGLAKVRDEIYNSKRLMQENLGGPVESFCYPAGRFNPTVKALVQEADYQTAFATAPGWAYSNKDVFAIKRIRISESSESTLQFWWRVSGYYLLFRERSARRMKG